MVWYLEYIVGVFSCGSKLGGGGGVTGLLLPLKDFSLPEYDCYIKGYSVYIMHVYVFESEIMNESFN